MSGNSGQGQSVVKLVPTGSAPNKVAMARSATVSGAGGGYMAKDLPAQMIADSSPEAFVSIDKDGVVLVWNGAAERTFGFSREDAIGQPLSELIMPPHRRAAHHAGLRRRVLHDEGPLLDRRVEVEAVHRDGSEIPLEMMISAGSANGRKTFNAFLRDIREKREWEATDRRLAAIVENSSDAIVSTGKDGVITSWNSGAEKLYGYTSDEMVGKSIARLYPRPDFADAFEVYKRLLRGERVSDFETRERRKDGSLVEVAVSASPLTNTLGTIVGISSITRDISQRKSLERTLGDVQRRYRLAFDGAPIGMALANADGEWVAANPALCEFLGRNAAEVIRIGYRGVTHPDDLDAGVKDLERVMAGEIESFEREQRCLRSDGSVVWGRLRVSLIRDDDGSPLYLAGQVTDITDQKRAEQTLADYTHELNSLAQVDPVTGLSSSSSFEATLADAVLTRAGGQPHGSIVRFHLGSDSDRDLQRLAETVKRKAALPVHVGRCSDGGLGLVLIGATSTAAEAAARDVAISAESFELDATLLVGTASWPDDGEDPEALMSLATKRMRDLDLEDSFGPRMRVDPAAQRQIGLILSLARSQLDMDLAFIGELGAEVESIRAVDGDAESFGVAVGTELALEASYCQRMVDGRIGSVIGDASANPEVSGLKITSDAGIGSYVGVPLRTGPRDLYGALCVVSHGPRKDLGPRELAIMKFLADMTAEVLDQHRSNSQREQGVAQLAGMRGLISALEARDLYTGKHSHAVVSLALEVAGALGLDSEETRIVEQVATLHDIGKVGIPDTILQKPGPLTEEEWALMRQHPVIGERIVASTDGLSHLARAIRGEHERFDGTGYPDGLAGADIPTASRITLACDAYHAMVTDRPYRVGRPHLEAMAELKVNAGTQFDPAVAEPLLRILARRK